jgi:hypothetical protein
MLHQNFYTSQKGGWQDKLKESFGDEFCGIFQIYPVISFPI